MVVLYNRIVMKKELTSKQGLLQILKFVDTKEKLSKKKTPSMLTFFIRNSKIVQSTGMTFAVMGTTIHILNEANLVTYAISHIWSAIAIAGFFLTGSNQIAKGLVAKVYVLKKNDYLQPRRSNSTFQRQKDNSDVALP
jgi:hypothetical protein